MFKTKGTLTTEDCEWLLTASASDIRHRLRHDPRLVNRDMTSWRLEQKIGTNWNLIVRYGLWTFTKDLFRRYVSGPIRMWWWMRKLEPEVRKWDRENPPTTEFVKSTLTVRNGHVVVVGGPFDKEKESEAPVIE